MTQERLKDTAEIIGILAIVASLLFLGFEIQQSNRIAVASTEIGIRNSYSEFNRGLHTGSDVAEVMARAQQPGAEWTEAENLKVLLLVSDLLNVWMSVETACQNDLAPESTCAELHDDIRAFIGMFPGTRPMWEYFVESYPSLADTEVRRTINGALAER